MGGSIGTDLEGRALFYVTECAKDSYGRQYRNHHAVLLSPQLDDTFLNVFPERLRKRERFQQITEQYFIEGVETLDEDEDSEITVTKEVPFLFGTFFHHVPKQDLTQITTAAYSMGVVGNALLANDRLSDCIDEYIEHSFLKTNANMLFVMTFVPVHYEIHPYGVLIEREAFIPEEIETLEQEDEMSSRAKATQFSNARKLSTYINHVFLTPLRSARRTQNEERIHDIQQEFYAFLQGASEPFQRHGYQLLYLVSRRDLHRTSQNYRTTHSRLVKAHRRILGALAEEQYEAVHTLQQRIDILSKQLE